MSVITKCELGGVSLNVEEVNKPKTPIMAKHEIIERDGDLYQYMGNTSKNIPLNGVTLSGVDKETDRTTLEGLKEAGNTVAYDDGEDTITVIILDINFPHIGGQQASFYSGTIQLARYNQV